MFIWPLNPDGLGAAASAPRSATDLVCLLDEELEVPSRALQAETISASFPGQVSSRRALGDLVPE